MVKASWYENVEPSFLKSGILAGFLQKDLKTVKVITVFKLYFDT